jgi:C4-dicarboxylate-specific signal transduction histidine kinase
LWRHGEATARRRAVLVGGSFVLLLIVAVTMGNLIVTGVVRAPTPLTACFFLVILAMGYELGCDVVHAAQLASELRESERRSELAARAAEFAFWSWDMIHDQLWITARGRALLEFADSDRIDLDALLSRVSGDDREAVRSAMERVRRDGAVYEQDFRLALPSGKTRWIAARGQIEINAAGAPILLHGVALDITARLRMEQVAAEQRSEIAHLSRVATLGELSGSLAHEINQPLMGILSNAQAALRFLAADNANLDEVREILADIVEDDKRAGEVIRRLRALLKKGEVQHGSLDVNNVVDDVLRLTRNDLINRDVTATAELAPNLPSVLGDRIQLQQVLLNLVMNACDAMDGSAESCRLQIRTRLADGAGIEIAVSDRGRGVPVADLERIFEPFVTTKAHGMGLGLAVSRTIVAAHGGRLWAENSVGEGATFRLTLPLRGRAE